MKKLYIVRHAKSSWSHPELDDFDRPLNRRGKKSALEMGQRLSDRKVMPDELMTSPAKRAAATAKRIAGQISYPLEKVNNNIRLYHGSTNDMVNVIQSISDKTDTLMLFGHNPGLTDLANDLAGVDIYNIPTCGIAEINFQASSWKEVGAGKGELISFDYPKKIQEHSIS